MLLKALALLAGFGIGMMLVSCDEFPTKTNNTATPEPAQPSYADRVSCEKQARARGENSGYCWSNTKPEGGTR